MTADGESARAERPVPTRVFWAACALGGLAMLASTGLPVVRFFVANLDARIQYVVRPHDVVVAEHPLAADSLALLVAALALLAAAALGLAGRMRVVLVPIALAAALVGCFQGDRALGDWTGDPEGGYPYCTDEHTTRVRECGSSIIRVGAGRPRARPRPGIAYSAHPRAGVWVLLAASLPIALWAGFRLTRLLVRRRWLAILLFAMATALLLAYALAYLFFANLGYD